MRDGQHLKIKILIKAYLFCIYCHLFISLLATITSDPHSYFCSASLELLFYFVLLCHSLHASYTPTPLVNIIIHSCLHLLAPYFLLCWIYYCWYYDPVYTAILYSDLRCLFIVSHYVGSIGTSPGFNRVIIIVFYHSRFHWIIIINYKLQPCKGINNLQGEGK